MAPPTPIGSFIPPVTGLNNSLRPFANSFDGSGLFRSRAGSTKRRREESPLSETDKVFDLSQRYPPLMYPGRAGIDLASVRDALVAATPEREKIKPFLNDETKDSAARALAGSAVALYNLVEAIVEKAIVPMWQSAQAVGGGGAGDAPPREEEGKRELREALEKSELESVIFDANLGACPTFNRARLSANLSAGLKCSVVEKTSAAGGDIAEAVRVLDDAFSSVEDVEFLGKESKTWNNAKNATDPKNGSYCSMPVKLKFTDKDSRIFFETSIRRLGGPRATQSFPAPIRKEMATLAAKVRADNPGKIVVVRADAKRLAMDVLIKSDGQARWERLTSEPFPAGIMLPRFRTDTSLTAGGIPNAGQAHVNENTGS